MADSSLPGAGGGHTCGCGHAHEMEVGCSVCSCDLWTRPKSGGGHTADSETLREFISLSPESGGDQTAARAALKRLEAAANRTAEAEQERDRANLLLRDAESVIFEGVRADALAVTGCETWDELREDADEVRWNILGHLGFKIVDRRPWKRLARAEAAEAERAAAHAALRELVVLKDGPRNNDYRDRKPLAWEAARAVLGGPDA